MINKVGGSLTIDISKFSSLREFYENIDASRDVIVRKSYAYRNVREGVSYVHHHPPMGGVPPGTYCNNCRVNGEFHDSECPGPYNQFFFREGQGHEEGTLYSEVNPRPGPMALAPTNIENGNLNNMIQITIDMDDYNVAAKITGNFSDLNAISGTLIANNVREQDLDKLQARVDMYIAKPIGGFDITNFSEGVPICTGDDGNSMRIDFVKLKNAYDSIKGISENEILQIANVTFYAGKMSCKVQDQYTVVFNAGGTATLYNKNGFASDHLKIITMGLWEELSNAGGELCYKVSASPVDPYNVMNTIPGKVGKSKAKIPPQPSTACKKFIKSQVFPRPYPYSFSRGEPATTGYITNVKGGSATDTKLVRSAQEYRSRSLPAYAVPCTKKAGVLTKVAGMYSGKLTMVPTYKKDISPASAGLSHAKVLKEIYRVCSPQSALAEVNKELVRAAMYGYPNFIDQNPNVTNHKDRESAIFVPGTQSRMYGGDDTLVVDSRRNPGLLQLNREDLLKVLRQCAKSVLVLEPSAIFTTDPVENCSFVELVPDDARFQIAADGTVGFANDRKFVRVGTLDRASNRFRVDPPHASRDPREERPGHHNVFVVSKPEQDFDKVRIFQRAPSARPFITSAILKLKVSDRRESSYKISYADGTPISDDILRAMGTMTKSGDEEDPEVGYVLETKTVMNKMFGKKSSAVRMFMFNTTVNQMGEMNVIVEKPLVWVDIPAPGFDHTRDVLAMFEDYEDEDTRERVSSVIRSNDPDDFGL